MKSLLGGGHWPDIIGTLHLPINISVEESSTVVPLMRSPRKTVSQKGLPYLVGNQELKPLVSLPDYPPNKANPF